MTNTKKAICYILILLTCATAFLLVINPAKTSSVSLQSEEYLMRAKIVSVEGTDVCLVECEDAQGELWGFYADKGDWNKGDSVLLLMRQKDNAVLDVRLDPFSS